MASDILLLADWLSLTQCAFSRGGLAMGSTDMSCALLCVARLRIDGWVGRRRPWEGILRGVLNG